MKKSYKRITLEQRYEIKRLLSCGYSPNKIASTMGFSTSSIYYELRRSNANGGEYDPDFADALSRKNRTRNKMPPILVKNPSLAKEIASLILDRKYSPKQITDYLSKHSPDGSSPISIPTIYRAIDSGYIPGVSRETLQNNESTMFSNGLICIPKWIRDKYSFCDGDSFSFSVMDDGTLLVSKQ